MNLLVLMLFCALCGTTAALCVTCRRLWQQEQRMEDAAFQIAEYVLDRRKGGIECNEEACK